jgi:hypothetical protein
MGGFSEGLEKVAGQAGGEAQAQYNTERQESITAYDKKYGVKQRSAEVNYKAAIDKILKNVDIGNTQALTNQAGAMDEYMTSAQASGSGGSGGSGGSMVQTSQGGFVDGERVPPGYSEDAWRSMSSNDKWRANSNWRVEQGNMEKQNRVSEAKNMMVYKRMGTNPFGSSRYGYQSIYDSQAGMV